MIPIKLELRNFIAYRDPDPINFEGLHVACLVGENGAGKSSLLDAITWSLWGKARVRRDDELIHLGETEMWVRYTFQFNANIYRITRYRTSAGRGSSELTIEVKHGEDWTNISEAGIRDTQRTIDNILRLDYDTFLNSAFLAQGRADEFTSNTPSKRKEILGEILGLSRWRDYEAAAKAEIKELNLEEAQLKGELDNIEDELARKDEYQAELIEAQQTYADISEELREVETAYTQAQGLQREADSLRGQLEQYAAQIEDASSELERLHAQQEQLTEQFNSLQQVLTDREIIEECYEALQQARAEDQAYSQKLIEVSDLQEEIGQANQVISEARSELEAEKRALQREQTALQTAIAESPAQHVLDEIEREIAALETHEADCDSWRARVAEIQQEQAGLRAEKEALHSEMEVVAARRDQINASDEPLCPLCGQDLNDEDRERLLEDFQEEGARHKEKWVAVRDRIGTLSQEHDELQAQIRAVEPKLKRLTPLRDRRSKLLIQMEQREDAAEELAAVADEIAAIEGALADSDYAHASQERLATLQEEVAAVGYDREAHEIAKTLANDYAEYENKYAEIDKAADRIADVEERLTNCQEEIERWQTRLDEAETHHREAETALSDLNKQLGSFEELEQRRSALRDEEGIARERVGAADQKLNALEHRRQRKEELLEKRASLADERGIYEELRNAFSKDGVPAMIIETAIPEIEQEANDILAQLTRGRMYIQFETQREKVTGGVKETLDIRISDELGTRSYDTYSGGESFRVNFAVRLALSRILARRAGARLRTLIIDEGFGTQDAQGRERLIQAINAVQEEFDLILVITHIEELKDAFPARIEITKTPRGSLIEVA